METIVALLASAVIVLCYWVWRLHIRIEACVFASAMSFGKMDKKFHDVGELLKEICEVKPNGQ